MKKILGKLLYRLGGWKLINTVDTSKVDKCVLVCAPHTSNWDFYYAIVAFWQMGIPMKMFIKDAWTKPWYGFIIKSMGGIGIDRTQRNNSVQFAAEILRSTPRMYLINTPEGTRSFSEKWKTGFLYISQEANVPIALAFCDYEKKEAGIAKIVDTEGRTHEDILQEIEDFYRPIKGKYPEKYNQKIY
ncbi:1-acyl-sn-glycerol-3-phosphate acyltransferase [Weeksella virosa]|mgnify:CR=1 FL=1|uniref:Phospholipid/glycerol acyltransferase n=1 Tax=Weeksella virosa (strain ATCC 43766 / DSM 16922 / JCM 21250 / CCUG 30538 / CDC 9751 / IAM 14551 / NBRC 16016 / NCTC 11634 / CL345/78) TaxID=865938 RepID=F0NYI6_WEEVC|nr:1-acyl-sn-glycerol-3-phosphate acyltransferase [Weeksella virosa]ADX67106.1 phospholipid/glycerol acyltransferase [Weeksella virosa DSM 16922]MDK7675033.1 1-acyl-sn-glycerol-3-phosphate acyltransferase [Weeksella virosa]SUP53377.1 1-acylglycerol-3-phosphate O-acyltransferases [Weeksella virosa]VEH63157.1 1-acylglycerol-3-phosphate O-acyltransferases [Weeksella virosa]